MLSIFIHVIALGSFLSVALAVDHQVVVGGQGLVFTPAETTAEDTVTFIWQPGSHTVTQSTFADPCTLLSNGSSQGFNSGPVPVAKGAAEAPAWTLQVTSAKPIWYFCATGTHCQAGMVGAINAPSTGNKTYAAFKSAAMGTTSSSGGSSPVSSGVGAEATGALSSVAGTGAGTPTASSSAATGSASGRAPAASASATGGTSTLSKLLSALLLAATVAVAIL